MGNCCDCRGPQKKDTRGLKLKQVAGTTVTTFPTTETTQNNLWLSSKTSNLQQQQPKIQINLEKELLIKTVRDDDNYGKIMTVKSATFKKPFNELVKILSQSEPKSKTSQFLGQSNLSNSIGSTLPSSFTSHQTSNSRIIQSNLSGLDGKSNLSSLGSNISSSSANSDMKSTVIDSEIHSSFISGSTLNSNIDSAKTSNISSSKNGKDSTTKQKQKPKSTPLSTIPKTKQKGTQTPTTTTKSKAKLKH